MKIDADVIIVGAGNAAFCAALGHCQKIKKPQPFWLGLYHFNAWQ